MPSRSFQYLPGWPQQVLVTIVLWLRHRSPTPMTHHPIARITENRNPKSQEIRF
jgi:hypothetical protein